MESWTGNQGQPPLYNKFLTVPGRHISHKYQDMQNMPHFQQYSHERNFSHDLNRWTVPGCRTGGVLQDFTNWTEPIESYFPASPPTKYQPRDFNDWQKRDGMWTQIDMERVQKEHISESRMQMQGIKKKWDSHSPPLYRSGKRTRSDASYRELEAWAARYCHSLPRKRCLEAELYGTRDVQGVLERERASYWVSRSGNTDTQDIINPSAQHRHIRGWQEKVDKPVSFTVPWSSTLEKSWSLDRKENNPGCQQRMLDKPPLYVSPPPYSAAHNIYGAQLPLKYVITDTINQQGETWEQHHTHNYKFNTLPASRKQGFHGILSSKAEGFEEWKKSTDIDCRQRHVDKTGKCATAHLELPAGGFAPLHSPRHSEVTAKPREVLHLPPVNGKPQVNKRMRRGTVFCLVSRPGEVAGMPTSPKEPLQLYSSPELNLKPLINTASTDEELSRKECVEGIRAGQSTDEFDCGKPQQCQYSSLINKLHFQTLQKMECNSMHHGVPAWLKREQANTHKEELMKAIQSRPQKTVLQAKKVMDREAITASCSTDSRSPVLRKRTRESDGPSSKFPLWKIPGELAQSRNTPVWQCCTSSVKHQSNNNPLSDSKTKHNQGRTYEQQESASPSSNGLVVIDATCVVVRVEFILPPQKEHVQYLYTPHGVNNGFLSGLTSDNPQTDTVFQPELNLSPQNLNVQGNEEDSQGPETHLKQSNNEIYGNLISQVATETNLHYIIKNHKLEETKCDHLFSTTVPVSESLEQRALRILGLSHLDPTLLEMKKNESSQVVPVCDTESTEFSSHVLSKTLELEDSSTEFEEGTNLVESFSEFSENKYLTSPEKATDEEVKMKSSKEELNSLEQPVQNVSEKHIVFDPAEKFESIVTEGTCCDEALFSPQETSSNTGEIVSPPLLTNSCSISPDLPLLPSQCLSICDYSTTNKKDNIIPEQKEGTTSDIWNSILLQSPSDSVSSPLSHTGSSTICRSSPEAPLSKFRISSGPQKDNTSPLHCPSLLQFPLDPASDYKSPSLCPDIHVFEHDSTEMQLIPPSESLEESCCPRSLWDAVNRIRRHTAPDSEDEEQECGEIWDNQEIVSEEKEIKRAHEPGDCTEEKLNFQSQKLLVVVGNDIPSSLTDENTSPNGFEDSNLLGAFSVGEETESKETEQYEKDLEKQEDDDSLSCSSSDSHTSNDTVIMSQGDEVQIVSNEIFQEAREYP